MWSYGGRKSCDGGGSGDDGGGKKAKRIQLV